ncbi:MAG: SDR family NAD(P)-dependent oxidoreductase [Actinobacteria bacterium]|nr:SDR family NAD(P)-dependent oxidoreductase [Actinomycetota bacterium]
MTLAEFAGKVGVITGGAGGIGLALARRFAAEGMSLVLADIDAGLLELSVAGLVSEGVEVIGVPADVSSRDGVQTIADAAMERFGAIHLACNNAGVATGGLSWEVSDADWEWVLGVDLWSVIYGVSIFTPLIAASGGGHVVNTASMAGLTSPPFMAPYNVAKHGVVALSESMYHELEMTGSNVGVSLLCPGWVKTRIHESDRYRPNGSLNGSSNGEAEAADSPGASVSGVVAGLVEAGISPESVADLVADAVKVGRFYILTHPDWNSMVMHNTRSMLEGENPKFSFGAPS